MEGDWGAKWFGDGVDDGFYHGDCLRRLYMAVRIGRCG